MSAPSDLQWQAWPVGGAEIVHAGAHRCYGRAMHLAPRWPKIVHARRMFPWPR